MDNKVKEIIARVLHVPVEEIKNDTEIGELDEWDSLHNLTIFAELQKAFDVKITQNMLIDLENVADIIVMLKGLGK